MFPLYNHKNGVTEKADDSSRHVTFGAKLDSIFLDSSSFGAASKCILSHDRKSDWVPQEDLWIYLRIVVMFLKSCAANMCLFYKLDSKLTTVVAFDIYRNPVVYSFIKEKALV